MTATKLPNALPRPPGELERLQAAWQPPQGLAILKSVNNTHIGLFYIGTSLLMFVLAGALALVMRTQLALPDNDVVSERLYNQLFTMHGTVMMFLFAVPVVEAIAVYLLPNMLGARDLPFPRLSAYAFWAYAFGALAFFATIFFDAAPDGGWFMYPPLTGMAQSPGIGADWWLLGIGFIEISAIAGAVELVVGILMTRAPGMRLGRMPIYAWSMLVVGFMIVFAFPAIIAGTALLEMERALDWPFFIAERGGDPVLWQHLFWFFGHPEVYIIFLPAAGLVSMMVPVAARTPIVGYRAIVVALVAVGFFSFALWVHHMFTAGLGALSMAFVSAASMAVAIPSGIQVFAWLATLWRGDVRPPTATTLFLLAFLFIFVLGGLTGVMVAVQPFDTQVHDTYFVVAHFHYVLIGGLVFPMFAALVHWLPLIRGHALRESVGRWCCALMFVGFNLAFFPMHIAGLLGMPRRVAVYPADAGLDGLNLLSTLGAYAFAAGVALFLVEMLRALARPKREPGDPWRAATLEWLPNEHYGARSIAQVESRDPLWRRPSLRDEVPAGRHWLPGTASGERETLITSPVAARIVCVQRLPGDSWLPFVAALGTAGFFMLLTVKWTLPAFAFGIVGLVAVLRWLWQTDTPPPFAGARIGDDVQVPLDAHGAARPVFWGVVVLLLVDATVFASFLFAHVHVSLLAAVCPPPGAALPAAQFPLVGAALALAGSACIELARRVLLRRLPVVALLGVACACALASFAAFYLGHAALQPKADAWSATVAAMLSYLGLHALVLLAMGTFVGARSIAGRLRADARASFDATAPMWHYATLQALVFAGVVQWLPAWLQ
jgi:cytochrome c oxidase subunit I+III